MWWESGIRTYVNKQHYKSERYYVLSWGFEPRFFVSLGRIFFWVECWKIFGFYIEAIESFVGFWAVLSHDVTTW